MNISSRGIAKTETKYKNKFWEWIFNIKLAIILFPKLQKKVSYELITDYKLTGYDIVK